MNKQFIVFTLVSAFFVSVVTAVLHQTGLGSPYLTFPFYLYWYLFSYNGCDKDNLVNCHFIWGTMYTVGPFLRLLIYSLRRSM